LIDWYDYLFEGAQNEFATDKSSTTGQPVRIFVMAANTYRQESDWPPPEAKPTRYFLHSDGSANSLRGDCGLSLTPPKKETPDKFMYDPANPMPTIGGSLCCDAEHYDGERWRRARRWSPTHPATLYAPSRVGQATHCAHVDRARESST
jgi:hypothetical protein